MLARVNKSVTKDGRGYFLCSGVQVELTIISVVDGMVVVVIEAVDIVVYITFIGQSDPVILSDCVVKG